jgi:hypothetical protein
MSGLFKKKEKKKTRRVGETVRRATTLTSNIRLNCQAHQVKTYMYTWHFIDGIKSNQMVGEFDGKS